MPRELGLWEENPWGNIIEDRGSQITFSALGQEAPLDAKRAWDPDGTKKAALRDAVQPDVPELDVRGGGYDFGRHYDAWHRQGLRHGQAR